MDWKRFINSNLEQVASYKPGLREEEISEISQAARIYKLSSNESPYPPFPQAIEAMRDSLLTLNEYPDSSSSALSQALSALYGVPCEQIIIGNGSNEIIDDIATACLRPGDNVVFCSPSFVVYRSSALIVGAQCRELPLDAKGSFDLDAMLGSIDDRTRIAYVCTPNNPSGNTVTDAAFAEFMRKVPDHVLVIADSAYQEFCTDPQSVDAMRYFDGERPLVVLRTFSKMFSLAGIRCGYGFAPPALVEAVGKVREPFNVNTVAQAGALACLNAGDELSRRREANAKGREALCACFADLGLRYCRSEANFVWVELADAQKAFMELLRRGIIVRAFAGVDGLRVGVGDEEGVAATCAAFREIMRP
jgi:histidinol-phosphate aminotransferase